jgi:lysophospholipase L1-like esterase
MTKAQTAPHVVLLGDSIFDNGAYVPGEPDVVTQLRGILPDGWTATLVAIDGSVTSDVKRQLETIPLDATHLVVSAGGNDALQHIGLLSEQAASVAGVLDKLATVKREFQQDYGNLIEAVLARGLPTVICTIYEANFVDATTRELANVGLSIFNDVITREASAHDLPLIDLRLLFDSPEDYANEIEPSAKGGEKIARRIAKLVTTRSMGRCFSIGSIGAEIGAGKATLRNNDLDT